LKSAKDILDIIPLPPERPGGPLILPWPVPGNPGSFLSFSTLNQWRSFIQGLGLHSDLPQIVTAKFERAQKLYYLGWIDTDLIKAGELAAMIALELALKNHYGANVRKWRGKIRFADLLKHMVEGDGLTDAQIPMFQKYGGRIVANLYKTEEAQKARKGTNVVAPMTLVEIRNSQAHGDPFGNQPYGGLLELVRDLIEYAYWDTALKPKARRSDLCP